MFRIYTARPQKDGIDPLAPIVPRRRAASVPAYIMEKSPPAGIVKPLKSPIKRPETIEEETSFSKPPEAAIRASGKISADSTPRLPCTIGLDVLNANLVNLGESCKRFLDSGVDFLHFDVMDGTFTYEISFGHHLVKAVRDALGADVFLDVHIMAQNPEKWLQPMANAGANRFTFNMELFDDGVKTSNLLENIKKTGMENGLAILPKTPVGALLPFCDMIDTAVIITVDPQVDEHIFLPKMASKVKEIRSAYPLLNIQVDGDIGPTNVDLCAFAGANSVVAGPSVSSIADPSELLETMYQHMKSDLRQREKSYSFTEYYEMDERF